MNKNLPGPGESLSGASARRGGERIEGDDDVEGHRMTAPKASGDDDVEGHRMTAPRASGDDDVEGHRMTAPKAREDEPDLEGHGRSR